MSLPSPRARIEPGTCGSIKSDTQSAPPDIGSCAIAHLGPGRVHWSSSRTMRLRGAYITMTSGNVATCRQGFRARLVQSGVPFHEACQSETWQVIKENCLPAQGTARKAGCLPNSF